MNATKFDTRDTYCLLESSRLKINCERFKVQTLISILSQVEISFCILFTNVIYAQQRFHIDFSSTQIFLKSKQINAKVIRLEPAKE